MDKTLQLIDHLIAEHKTIGEKTQSVEKAVNDITLLSGLKEAREAFVPGQNPQKEDLDKLDRTLVAINTWLEKHFNREETVLLPAVKNYGDRRLTESLNSILFEHTDLKDRLLHSRKRVDELKGKGISQSLWETRASDTRTYISHTRKLLETHAARENHFLKELRQYIKKHGKGKE
jgi:hypothetical protein